MRSSVCLREAGSSPQGAVPAPKLRAGLRCWRAGPSATAATTSDSTRGCPCGEAHVQLPSLSSRTPRSWNNSISRGPAEDRGRLGCPDESPRPPARGASFAGDAFCVRSHGPSDPPIRPSARPFPQRLWFSFSGLAPFRSHWGRLPWSVTTSYGTITCCARRPSVTRRISLRRPRGPPEGLPRGRVHFWH